ncbi:hypothetical protein D3C72_1791490 [compost metagenome]
MCLHFQLDPGLGRRLLQALGGEEGVGHAGRAGGDGEHVRFPFRFDDLIAAIVGCHCLILGHRLFQQVDDKGRGQGAEHGSQDITHLAFHHRQHYPAAPGGMVDAVHHEACDVADDPTRDDGRNDPHRIGGGERDGPLADADHAHDGGRLAGFTLFLLVAAR